MKLSFRTSQPIVSRTLLVLLSLALGFATTSPVFGAAPSPKTLNVRLSDVPGGFTQTVNAWVSNAQFAREEHVSLTTLRAEGRVISYDAAFGGAGPDGFIGVLAGVTEFRTVKGARQDYALETAPSRQVAATHSKQVRVIPFSTIGDVRFGFKTPDTVDGKPAEGCSVMFHRGRYWAIVLAYTRPNHNSCAWTARYARLIDTRIERA